MNSNICKFAGFLLSISLVTACNAQDYDLVINGAGQMVGGQKN